MSWDVVVMEAPSDIESPEELPSDFSSNLGPRQKIHDLLLSLFPDIDLSDPSWAILDGAEYSIEFSIGSDDPVASIMLHVRGSDDAVSAIQQFCDAGGWRAMDMGDCEFLDFARAPASGLQSWRGFRDSMADAIRAKGGHVEVDPKLNGIRVDAVVDDRSTRKWWQFWR